MSKPDIVPCTPVRTPIASYGGALKDTPATELDLPEDIVNVEGGSIAHGHAIGATGAVLTTRLLHSMRRDQVKRGIVTLCIGGGQGIALALEAL
jgi:acetyl-CoA acetyltransferase